MEDDIVTAVLGVLSTLSLGGLGAVAAKLRRGFAPLAAQRAVRVCLCAPADTSQGEARNYRNSLLRSGYKHVALTHAPSAATGYDIVLLWKPTVETSAAIVTAIRSAAPLSYMCLYTLDRLPVPLDDHMLLSNSPVRLRADLATVAEVVAAEEHTQ